MDHLSVGLAVSAGFSGQPPAIRSFYSTFISLNIVDGNLPQVRSIKLRPENSYRIGEVTTDVALFQLSSFIATVK